MSIDRVNFKVDTNRISQFNLMNGRTHIHKINNARNKQSFVNDNRQASTIRHLTAAVTATASNTKYNYMYDIDDVDSEYSDDRC